MNGMTQIRTLFDVTKQLTPRQFMGTVVMDEIARRWPSITRFTDQADIGRTTLYKIRDGKEVPAATLRYVEGALDMPARLLDLIAAADAKRIAALPGVREDLRQYLVETLADMATPPRRRSTDRRAAL